MTGLLTLVRLACQPCAATSRLPPQHARYTSMTYAIVVDTSVARAASSSSANAEARCCWLSLDAMGSGGYRLAMNRQLHEEWLRTATDRPQGEWRYYVSRHAMSWLTEMTSRGRVMWVGAYEGNDIRSRIFSAVGDQRIRETSKDLHLVEAALASDSRVISCDREIRRSLIQAATQVEVLRSILWVHPLDNDAPLWLADGARDVPVLRLGGPSKEDALCPPI